MKNNDSRLCLDDENEFWDIAKKHSIGLEADEPVDMAFVLCKETRKFLKEILEPEARNQSIFRIRRQMRMAIDMLIDAERLASMPI